MSTILAPSNLTLSPAEPDTGYLENAWIDTSGYQDVWVDGYYESTWVDVSGYMQEWVISGYYEQQWFSAGYYMDVWIDTSSYQDVWVSSGYNEQVWVDGYTQVSWIDTSGYESQWVESGYYEQQTNENGDSVDVWVDTSSYQDVWVASGYSSETWIDGYYEVQWIDTSGYQSLWVESGYYEQQWVDDGYYQDVWVDTSHYEDVWYSGGYYQDNWVNGYYESVWVQGGYYEEHWVNLNDAPTGAVQVSGDWVVGQTLTASHTLGDADGMGAVTYQWLANGVAISGAQGASLTLTQALLGQVISVQATYTDGHGTVEHVRSAGDTVASNQPGLLFTQAGAGQIITTEAAGTDSLGVALQAVPQHDVQVTLTLSDASEVVFDATGTTTLVLTFTASNWAQAQTVVLRGVDDPSHDGDTPYTISSRISSADPRYDGLHSGQGQPIVELSGITQDDDQPDEGYGDAGGVVNADQLWGGHGASDLYGLLGQDVLHGGNGDDRLYGGYGDDTLYGEVDDDELEGEQGNDKLYGGDGNDNLKGGTGKDTLIGGAGNDTLQGGEDGDSMDGGNGADVYYMDSTADVISDSGSDGQLDTLYVSTYLSGAIQLGAGIDQGVLNAQAGNGSLKGNGGNNTLDGNNGNNQLDGGSGNDGLYAASGDDTLAGGAGNDTLNGGAGADSMSGGDGTDTYYVNNSADQVVETNANASTGGKDLVLSSLSRYMLGAYVENGRITASGSADLSGNGLDNVLYAGAGNNVLSGGRGSDTAHYGYAASAVTVNLTTTLAQNTGGSGRDTLSGIENLTGSKYHDKLSGNSSGNRLDGGAGNDALSGGSGNDTLLGGVGKDSLTGGTGNDVFDFNALSELGLGSSARDVITDFVAGQDKIDLSSIDANSALAGDQAFKFVSSFTTTAGQVRYSKGIVYLNTDSDTAAEFEIQLTGNVPAALTAVNFVL